MSPDLTHVLRRTTVRSEPATEGCISLGRLVARLCATDGLAALVAATIAVAARFGERPGSVHGVSYGILSSLLPAVWVGSMWLAGAYQRRVLVAGAEEFRRVCNGGVWLFAAIAFASYSLRAEVSRGLVILIVPLVTAITLIFRYLTRKAVHRTVMRGRPLHRVLAVGAAEEVGALIHHMRRSSHVGFVVVGACLPKGDAAVAWSSERPIPVVHDVDDLLPSVRRLGADTLAIAGSESLRRLDLRQLSWDLEGSGIALVVAPAITDVAGPRISVRPVEGLPLLHVEEPRFTGPQRIFKEAFDVLGASVGLLLFGPLMALVATIIGLCDQRPVLYRQERIGIHGERFRLWKFRTMRLRAEEEQSVLRCAGDGDGVLFKMRQDPRVTPLGRWLRRYSLDELPQLWNVLMGNMSLVGPRPPLPREVEEYGDAVRRRLLVKPGMTGLWQVSGRSDTSWEESVRLDLYYVEHWSVWLDIMVLWKTVGAVVRGRGAY